MPRKSSDTSHYDLIFGFPPIDEGTVVLRLGDVNRPTEIRISFANLLSIVTSSEVLTEMSAYHGFLPTFLENYGFNRKDSAEILIGDAGSEFVHSIYFIGNGLLQSLLDDKPLTIGRNLPSPTSVLVSFGENSVLIDQSGRITQYRHPEGVGLEPVDIARSFASLTGTDCLLPQVNTHIWFGNCACEHQEHMDAWMKNCRVA